MLLRERHTRRETVTVLFGGQRARKARNRAKKARFVRREGRGSARLGGRDAALHVQQVLAGKLRLVGDEGESRLGLGAHQPLDRLRRGRAIQPDTSP